MMVSEPCFFFFFFVKFHSSAVLSQDATSLQAIQAKSVDLQPKESWQVNEIACNSPKAKH
jgi:hypothetical protein